MLDEVGVGQYLRRPFRRGARSSAVEHHLDMVVVTGSIPIARTNFLVCATLMPVITLPDGGVNAPTLTRSRSRGAADIGPGLAKAAVAGRVNGRLVGTVDPITQGRERPDRRSKDPEGLEIIRHSFAHLVESCEDQAAYPTAKMVIGPVIDDGFFYDIAYERPFTPDDLAAIETRMREADREGLRRHRRDDAARQQVIETFKKRGEDYKLRLVDDMPGETAMGLYHHEEYVDMCRGPHVPNNAVLAVIQAHEARRRVLARRFDERDASAHLRHGVGG